MSADFIVGDVFLADRVAQKVYGIDVSEKDVLVAHTAQEEIPEFKCNTVSYIKAEPVTGSCRNVLAVSESFICYSVRKNLLRVIDTVSSEKALLRGHDHPILDIKFSAVDSSILCSVDDTPGDDASVEGSKTIIWNLSNSSGLTSRILAQFPLGANIVQAHPEFSQVWAVA